MIHFDKMGTKYKNIIKIFVVVVVVVVVVGFFLIIGRTIIRDGIIDNTGATRNQTPPPLSAATRKFLDTL